MNPTSIRKIHLIFKTHLDVGYTDFARNVLENYIEHFIPNALRLARQLREAGGPERFVWTTGSWLIYEYLEQASPAKRAEIEAAIAAGDIAWHGLPFTTYTDMLDAGLFRFGLGLSQELDRRFGKRTIAAKMTDVPGHTRAMLPLLVEAGIRFLHIGVNSASTPPDVPPVFAWRAPGGAEVLVMYHKGSYGDLMLVPGLDEAIAFAHTNDNLGPQPPGEIRAIFESYRRAFPGADVVASTMDAFATALARVRDSLPVVGGEIGNTWIHGVASDLLKVAQFRELQRLRRSWLAQAKVDPQDPRLNAFSRNLLLVAEHTWGLDEKVHLADGESWSQEKFQAARNRSNFRKFEASWTEQRGYIDRAVAALGDSPLAKEARQVLADLTPAQPEKTGMQPVSNLAGPFDMAHFQVGFDERGAVTRLYEKSTGHDWASPTHPLALFRYETFSQADYDRFYRQYVRHKRQVAAWAIPDFTKPGMASAGAVHSEWLPRLDGLYTHLEAQGWRFLLELSMPGEPVQAYGCPPRLSLEIQLPDGEPVIVYTLQWFGKPASRLPEAAWLSFCPRVKDGHAWKLEKMGQLISPLEVVRDGSRHLHAIGERLVYEGQDGYLSIHSLDAPVIAPGRRSLLDFNNSQPALRMGIHFLLYNNLWGTNHPMWYEGDARFRFHIHFR